jgi:hypothetical protein
MLTLTPPTPTLKAWLWLVAAPISRAAEAAAIRNRDLITMLLLCFLPAAAKETTLNCYPLCIHCELLADLFKRVLRDWITVSYYPGRLCIDPRINLLIYSIELSRNLLNSYIR